jgi:cell division protein FtsB
MARSRAAATVRRQPVPRHPRRVSGPARPVPVPGRPRSATIAPQPHETFAARLGALPDHRWLDMLLRSRAWIWLLGVALGGIVAMQVSLLGMNAGIGRAVEESATLQHRNAALEKQVAELSSGEKVRQHAAALGLISPDAGDVSFLTTRGQLDARRAIQRMTPPSDTARQTLATDGRPATAVTTAPTTTTTTATTAPTAAPTAAVTPAPTAAATPAATTAPPVATPALTAVPPTTAAGATQAP